MKILAVREREAIKENYFSILMHKNPLTPYDAYVCGHSSGIIEGMLGVMGFCKSNKDDREYLKLVIDPDFIKWVEKDRDQIRSHFLHKKRITCE